MNEENQMMNQQFTPGNGIPPGNGMPQDNKMPQQREWFWQDGLSIDETKMSTLIICLLVCMIFGGINYIAYGDITNNLTLIIQALIYAIAGVNIGNGLLNRLGGGSYYGSSTGYPINNMNRSMMSSNMTNPNMMNSNMMNSNMTTGIREAKMPESTTVATNNMKNSDKE